MQVFSVGTTVVVILATQKYGWNKHVWDLTYNQMEVGRQVSSPVTRGRHSRTL